ADDAKPDPLPVERIQLTANVETQQAHQIADLVFGPSPILRRKGIKGQALHPGLACGAQRPARSFGAFAMAGNPRQSPALRPAAVAVHDDGDVAGNRSEGFSAGLRPGAGLDHFCRISFSLAAMAASISAMVSSVIFCTSVSSLLCSS